VKTRRSINFYVNEVSHAYIALVCFIRLLGLAQLVINSVLITFVRFLHLWRYNGLKYAAKTYKEGTRLVLKYLAGTPVFAADGIVMGIDRHGLPCFLAPALRSLIRSGSERGIAISLLVMGVYKLFLFRGPIKTAQITDVPRYLETDLYSEIIPNLDWFGDLLHQAFPVLPWLPYGERMPVKVLSWKRYHSTNKQGPNGPALLSCWLDAVALRASQLWKPFVEYCRLTDSRALFHRVDHLSSLTLKVMSLFGLHNRLGSLPTGKISTKIEAAGKMRLFAIPGYFVQTLLRPLHDVVFSYLKEIPTDCTFNQGAGVDAALEWSRKGVQHFWSFDMEGATNRFPVVVTEALFVSLLSP
jgi:hypothetical protein